MPLPATHFAFARAQFEQARPYGAGIPKVGAALGSIVPAFRINYWSNNRRYSSGGSHANTAKLALGLVERWQQLMELPNYWSNLKLWLYSLHLIALV